MTYLLDTNAWIQLFSSSASIPQNVRRTLAAENKLALAGISMIELCQMPEKVPGTFSLVSQSPSTTHA